MLRVFIGYDHRQPVSLNVLQQSIYRRSSKPVAITPLVLEQLPIKRTGLTPFTFSRFIVPWLCDYKGWGLFLDLDIILLDDIAKLFALGNPDNAVQIVKHKNGLEFERASVILFNCDKCQRLTPDSIDNPAVTGLHQMTWLPENLIGELPSEWNHLVGYDAPRDDAKLVHYTQGVPCFPETKNCEYSKEWHDEHKFLNSAYPWVDLMGNSVHAKILDGKPVPKFTPETKSV